MNRDVETDCDIGLALRIVHLPAVPETVVGFEVSATQARLALDYLTQPAGVSH